MTQVFCENDATDTSCCMYTWLFPCVSIQKRKLYHSALHNMDTFSCYAKKILHDFTMIVNIHNFFFFFYIRWFVCLAFYFLLINCKILHLYEKCVTKYLLFCMYIRKWEGGGNCKDVSIEQDVPICISGSSEVILAGFSWQWSHDKILIFLFHIVYHEQVYVEISQHGEISDKIYSYF